ncbi:hypothetical protein M0R45_037132 [Rubus argutus]|uniref:Cyclic nucleotide-binding domain-containing protein n=1 Tax=Rubus argutus TaxID=59490 RepID=A0AAW1W3C0_RUBAR
MLMCSFGSNLKPSTNAWENLFAAFISIIGLLLFLYLIGNLQTYMQLDTVNSIEKHLWKMRIEKKMEEKGREVEQWLSKNGIPSCKKLEIMEQVEVELNKDKDKDVDVENILSILPWDSRRYMKSCMPLNRLKQVPLLQNKDEKVLTEISEYLKPEKYIKNEIIIREKEPLEKMIFIVEGLVIIEMRGCTRTLQLRAEEVYGEKLLTWPAWPSFPSVLPVATESLRADGDVEALVLTASDIKDVVLKLKLHIFNKEEITRRTDDEWKLLESDRATMLRKVPKLETMNTRVLEAISENLKPMSGEGNFIIREGKPLRVMVFVSGGSLLSLEKDRDKTTEKRQFYGEELLDWVLDGSFPAIVPISTHGVWVNYNTDIFVLKANDLGDVVSNFKSYFSKETPSPTDDSSLDLCAIVGLT